MQNSLAGAYSAPVANALIDQIVPVAAAPVARRDFAVAPFAMPAPGQASVGMPGSGFRELDTRDPTARMALRAGVGQTVDDTARLYRLATEAAGWGGTMAGRAARTADLRALARAEEMRASGMVGDELRQETGWFRALFNGGGDNAWRFEIPDTNARFTPIGEQMVAESNNRVARPLSEVLHHPQYFEAYPDRASVRVTVERPDMPGSTLGSYSNDGPGYISLRGGRSLDDTRSTLLHELQHATQRLEGFPAGGNVQAMWLGDNRAAALTEYNRIVDRVATPMPFDEFARQIYGGRTGAEVEQAYSDYVKSNAATVRDLRNFSGPLTRDIQNQAAEWAYLRLPGEVEARVVQSRSLLDLEGLAARNPDLDYLRMWQGASP